MGGSGQPRKTATKVLFSELRDERIVGTSNPKSPQIAVNRDKGKSVTPPSRIEELQPYSIGAGTTKRNQSLVTEELDLTKNKADLVANHSNNKQN